MSDERVLVVHNNILLHERAFLPYLTAAHGLFFGLQRYVPILLQIEKLLKQLFDVVVGLG